MKPILGNKVSKPFTVNGETYHLVEPECIEDLQHAYRAKDILTLVSLSNNTDEKIKSDCQALLEEQERYIKEYLESVGDFNNIFLIGNINHLSKKYQFRIGEIENALGLSAGYISRTAKENSGKKMSIDVVWKIAKLFDIDIKKLIGTDLRIPESNSNTDLAARFLEKAYKDTAAGAIEWTNEGGVIAVMEGSISDTGFFTDRDDGPQPSYRSMFTDEESRFILYDDIFSCKQIINGCDVLIIPYYPEGTKRDDLINYDLLFRQYIDDELDPKFGTYEFKRFFTTIDSPWGHLDFYAGELYNLIKDREYETRLSPDAKKVIETYLGEGE